jgi:hypothetical protein
MSLVLFFLCKGYGVLQSNLTMLLEEGDLDSDLRFKAVNITKMVTYILTQMMQAFEARLTKKPNDGTLIESGKVRDYSQFLIKKFWLVCSVSILRMFEIVRGVIDS